MIALNGFLKLDPQLLSGKFSASFTFKTAQKRWEEIANALNAMPGAVKDWKKWRKTFQDNRTKTKTKKSAILAAQRSTGKNTPIVPLTTLENDTLELINSTSIEGHTGCMVSNVSFSFDIDDEVTEAQEYIEDSTIVLTPLIIEKPVNEDFIASPPLFPSQITPLNDSCTQVIEESNGNNESIKHAIKPKKSCAARRLIQGNESTEKLVDLGEKKILLKKRY
ncbi:uncharacterized protein LOC111026509 [Myzus persicae]|uniref:uncharacterized protein LOC111026509 n=1 Tax=Myzus persicae TaxID=13164 RepID=UPI000B932871|nr:uncharacterized protein LOC111026509 [Myzus persicae]